MRSHKSYNASRNTGSIQEKEYKTPRESRIVFPEMDPFIWIQLKDWAYD